jgi:tetratricopeptide (TPR) repeat protein
MMGGMGGPPGGNMAGMSSLNQSNADAWSSVDRELTQQAADPSMGQYSHGRKPDWREHVNEFKEEEEAAARAAGEEPTIVKLDPVAQAMEAAAIEKRQHEKLQTGYDEASRLKDEGAAVFKKKQYAEAVKFWGEALRSVDGYGRSPFLLKEREELRIALHNNRAVAQIQLRNFSAAEGDATDVLFSEPNNPKALFRRGQARIGKRDYHAAVADLEKLLELKPKDAKAAKALAEAREGTKAQLKAGEAVGGGSDAVAMPNREKGDIGPARVSKAKVAPPDPRECEGGMAFMRAQQHLGSLSVEELHAALVLEVGEEGMGGVGKYHSSLLQALSEALIAQGREQGDNDMPAKRATKIVVEAMATRISAALVPEKKVVAELVAVDKLYKCSKRHSADIEQFAELKELRERLFASAKAEVDALLEGQDMDEVKKESHRLIDLGWNELRPLTKSFSAVDKHINSLRNAERDRLEKLLQAEMAAEEARKQAQQEAKREGEKAMYSGRYAEAVENLNRALELTPDGLEGCADRALMTATRDRAVTRRDEEAAKEAKRAAQRAEDERKSAEVSAHMEALRKSLSETRARLGATVDANNAREAAMLKLPFEGAEALREAGGFSFYCSQSKYQLVDHTALWTRVSVEKIKNHARTYGKLSDYREIAPLLGNEAEELGEVVVVCDKASSCGNTHLLLVTTESIAALHELNPEAGILKPPSSSSSADGAAGKGSLKVETAQAEVEVEFGATEVDEVSSPA